MMATATMLGGLGNVVFGLAGQTLMGQGAATMAGYYPAQTTVWANWNTQYYNTATVATTAQVWGAWNQQFTVPELTPAQLEVQNQVHQRHGESKARARTLLIEHLDPVQRESYEKHGLFIVETPKKNRYRLGQHVGPRKLSGDKDTVSYCIHTQGIPREDELLGFKLLLEANEEEFLKTANATALAA